MPDNFKKFLWISSGAHLIIALFLIFSPQFNFSLQKPTKITWLKLSKGDGGSNKKANLKDLKGLPASTVREQRDALRELAKSKRGKDQITRESKNKKIEKAPLIKQGRTADKGGINIGKKSPTKPVTRIDDALARIDQQLEKREVEIGAAQARKEDTGQSVFGSDEGSDVDPALINYYNAIKRKINREWIVSKGEFMGALKTQIVVLIDVNGNILRTQYEKNSGDVSFDESAMRALKRAAPFPIPPDSIRTEALTEGFLIEFNPSAVTGRM